MRSCTWLTAVACVLATVASADTLLWAATVAGDVTSAGAFTTNNASIFVVANTSLQALSKADGTIGWTADAYPYGYDFLANVICLASDTTVMLYTEYQQILFFDAVTGKKLKQITAPAAVSYAFHYPGTFLLQGSSSITAFSEATLEQTWAVANPAMLLFAPASIDNTYITFIAAVTATKKQQADASSSSSSSHGSNSNDTLINCLYVVERSSGTYTTFANIDAASPHTFAGTIAAFSSTPPSLAVLNLKTGMTVWNKTDLTNSFTFNLLVSSTATAVYISGNQLFQPVSVTSFTSATGDQQWSITLPNASSLLSLTPTASGSNLVVGVEVTRGSSDLGSTPEFMKVDAATGSIVASIVGVPTSPSGAQAVIGVDTYVLNLQGFTRIDGATFTPSQVLTLPGLTAIAALGTSSYVVASENLIYAYSEEQK